VPVGTAGPAGPLLSFLDQGLAGSRSSIIRGGLKGGGGGGCFNFTHPIRMNSYLRKMIHIDVDAKYSPNLLDI
jgi:hypothetical protein